MVASSWLTTQAVPSGAMASVRGLSPTDVSASLRSFAASIIVTVSLSELTLHTRWRPSSTTIVLAPCVPAVGGWSAGMSSLDWVVPPSAAANAASNTRAARPWRAGLRRDAFEVPLGTMRTLQGNTAAASIHQDAVAIGRSLGHRLLAPRVADCYVDCP